MFIETGTIRDKKIKITLDQQNSIFRKEYRKDISLDEIKDSWIYCLDKEVIPSNCEGIVLDYRSARFVMNPREIFKLVDFYNNQLERLEQKRIAILTERPDQIVIPMLLSEKSKRFNIQVFTSDKAAIHWARSN